MATNDQRHYTCIAREWPWPMIIDINNHSLDTIGQAGLQPLAFYDTCIIISMRNNDVN